MFKKAVKEGLHLRLGLVGPSGSGKTYSALEIASALVGPGGKVAVVDTERKSASKYADIFSFDSTEPTEYDPRGLIKAIEAAESAAYGALIIDSLSHYWMGTGGELDMVDQAASRIKGNSFAAWKTVTPIHNQLVEKLLSCKLHVICTLRSKTEWVIEQVERNGKTFSQPRKVGLAPVMRDGLEYEFDVVGDMDQENNLTITKTRCPELNNKVINRPGKALAETVKTWLGNKPLTTPKQEPQTPPALPPNKPLVDFNTKAPANTPATTPEAQPPAPDTPPENPPATTAKKMADQLKLIREGAIKAGAKSQDEIRLLVGNLVGREIKSATELTAQEREDVLGVFAQEGAANG